MANVFGSSIRSNPHGDMPVVDPTSYVDPTAQIIGNVRIGERVYVGPNAVIRADEADDEGRVHSIEIAAECNVQDGVIIHALGGTQVRIGGETALGHGCIVHGPCVIGRESFVGFRAVVYDAVLGDGAFIGAGAVVQGVELGSNALVGPCAAILSMDDAGRLVGGTGAAEVAFREKVVKANVALAKEYLEAGE